MGLVRVAQRSQSLIIANTQIENIKDKKFAVMLPPNEDYLDGSGWAYIINDFVSYFKLKFDGGIKIYHTDNPQYGGNIASSIYINLPTPPLNTPIGGRTIVVTLDSLGALVEESRLLYMQDNVPSGQGGAWHLDILGYRKGRDIAPKENGNHFLDRALNTITTVSMGEIESQEVNLCFKWCGAYVGWVCVNN